MTTIVYANGELVADTLMTIDGMATPGRYEKIHLPKEGEYWEIMGERCIAFALSGMASGIEYIKAMLEKGIKHDTQFPMTMEMNYATLFVTESGVPWVQSVFVNKGTLSSYLYLATVPYALGSGADFAFALLSIRKSAQQAVKGASKCDVNTNDVLTVFTIPPKPEVPSKRPPAKPTEEVIAKEAADREALVKLVREEIEQALKLTGESKEYKDAERDVGRQKVAPSQTLGWNRM